jgi:hypothetical protein
MAEALLTLSTLIDRPHIVIDGQAYELRQPQELSIANGAAAARVGQQLTALGGKPMADLTDDEAAQIEGALAMLIAMILIAPSAMLERLDSHQRLAIGQAFFAQPRRPTGTETAARRPRPTPSTGARSSRGSSGSTAGRRRTG